MLERNGKVVNLEGLLRRDINGFGENDQFENHEKKRLTDHVLRDGVKKCSNPEREQWKGREMRRQC